MKACAAFTNPYIGHSSIKSSPCAYCGFEESEHDAQLDAFEQNHLKAFLNTISVNPDYAYCNVILWLGKQEDLRFCVDKGWRYVVDTMAQEGIDVYKPND